MQERADEILSYICLFLFYVTRAVSSNQTYNIDAPGQNAGTCENIVFLAPFSLPGGGAAVHPVEFICIML